MDKANKNRIIFWGCTSILLFIFFTIGVISYNNGYGKYGKIKKILNPIVMSFNSLEEIQTLKNLDIKITSSFAKDKINVVYKVDDVLLEYNFNYKNDENKLLITSYDNSKYTNINNLVTKLMIMAVNKNNKINEDNMFDIFEIDDFLNTSIEDGVSIKDIDNDRNVFINIDTYLPNNVTKEIVVEDYLTTDKITELYNESDNIMIYKDNNIILKINKGMNTILFKDLNNNDDRSYKLLTNVIESVYSDKYDYFKEEYPKIIKEEYNSDNFTILYLDTYSGDRDFLNQSNIIEIIIK